MKYGITPPLNKLALSCVANGHSLSGTSHKALIQASLSGLFGSGVSLMVPMAVEPNSNGEVKVDNAIVRYSKTWLGVEDPGWDLVDVIDNYDTSIFNNFGFYAYSGTTNTFVVELAIRKKLPYARFEIDLTYPDPKAFNIMPFLLVNSPKEMPSEYYEKASTNYGRLPVSVMLDLEI